MKVWPVFAAQQMCCRREYRPLGTVVAEDLHAALDKLVEFEEKLTDSESVCIGEGGPASVYDLLRHPQL